MCSTPVPIVAMHDGYNQCRYDVMVVAVLVVLRIANEVSPNSAFGEA